MRTVILLASIVIADAIGHDRESDLKVVRFLSIFLMATIIMDLIDFF